MTMNMMISHDLNLTYSMGKADMWKSRKVCIHKSAFPLFFVHFYPEIPKIVSRNSVIHVGKYVNYVDNPVLDISITCKKHPPDHSVKQLNLKGIDKMLHINAVCGHRIVYKLKVIHM